MNDRPVSALRALMQGLGTEQPVGMPAPGVPQHQPVATPEIAAPAVQQPVPMPMISLSPDEDAEIDRRITGRVRGGQYSRRQQSRENRYRALRDTLLSDPGIEPSGSMLDALQLPVMDAQPQLQVIPAQAPAEDLPQSALRSLMAPL